MRFLILTTLLLCSISYAKIATQKPSFGFTGTYEGQVMRDGVSLPATLQLLEFDGIIRGVLTINFDYPDDNGDVWNGASVLLKGDSTSNQIFVTDYQCSAVVKLCDRFGEAEKDFMAKLSFSKIESGSDYTLFKVSLDDMTKTSTNSERKTPFENGVFEMTATIADSHTGDNSWIGNWTGVGYFPSNYVVRSPRPFFSEIDFVLYSDDNDEPHIKWWVSGMEGWSPVSVDLDTYSADSYFAIVAYDYHRYKMNRRGAYVYGLVDSIYNDSSKYFDFWALFFVTK